MSSYYYNYTLSPKETAEWDRLVTTFTSLPTEEQAKVASRFHGKLGRSLVSFAERSAALDETLREYEAMCSSKQFEAAAEEYEEIVRGL